MDAYTIEKIVCDYYGVCIKNVRSRTRKVGVCLPRQIIMTLCMIHLNYTSVKAGLFYNRDHTTALHAKRTVLNIFDTDQKIRLEITEIENIISKHKKINLSYANNVMSENVDLLKLTINYTNSIINYGVNH